MKKVLLVGCGDIGQPLGRQLLAAGAEVWGLRRSEGELAAGFRQIRADVTDPDSLQPLKDMNFDSAVITLVPAGFDDDSYRRVFVEGLANLLAVLRCEHIVFVSSSSVYQQSDEQWVDEDSITEPASFSGRRLLEAEALLAGCDIDSTVVRFAGIYGPGRRRLIDQVLAGEGSAAIYSNRIHRDDCVGVLAHLVAQQWAGVPLQDCYLAVDSEPVKLSELKHWLALQLGVDPATMTATAATRRASKRCSNRRLLASGYQLLYPGYRQGYTAVLADTAI